MRLRALVVEDEWAARNYLVELLHAAGAEVVGAVATIDDARAVLDAPDGGPLDVAFVDVQLVGSDRDDDGLELVRAHAPRAGAPAFVLATAFGQHALAAFELGVVDYLLKPFTQARVEECLARVGARRPAAPAAPFRIVARRRRALVFLRLEEVWAFEAADRLAYVHTTRGRFDVDLSLSAIDASFGRTLLRVHRNWLVNPDHVQELEGTGSDTELLVGPPAEPEQGVRVPVARDRVATVRDALLGNATGLRAR
jgi:DNA-binding LytR/AlgR family response regulator